MLVNLRLLFGLLWQPMSATQRLRERAPVAFAVFAAGFMAFVYRIVASALVEWVRKGWRACWEAGWVCLRVLWGWCGGLWLGGVLCFFVRVRLLFVFFCFVRCFGWASLFFSVGDQRKIFKTPPSSPHSS